MSTDTSGLSDTNVFKSCANINEVARVIARLLSQGANYAGTLSETWAVSDANKQNSLYDMITNGMNLIALDFQAWDQAPDV